MSGKYNPFLKCLINKYDFNNLVQKYFIQVPFEDLKVGDIVQTTTITYSQKYTLYDGYEEYNMTKVGILLEKNMNNPGSSRLYRYVDGVFEETNLFADPGTSGFVGIHKYFDYLENK